MKNFLLSLFSNTIGKIFYLITALFLISFVISNQKTVNITLWPFSFNIEVLLFLLVLVVFLAGFICGYIYKLLKNKVSNDKS